MSLGVEEGLIKSSRRSEAPILKAHTWLCILWRVETCAGVFQDRGLGEQAAFHDMIRERSHLQGLGSWAALAPCACPLGALRTCAGQSRCLLEAEMLQAGASPEPPS